MLRNEKVIQCNETINECIKMLNAVDVGNDAARPFYADMLEEMYYSRSGIVRALSPNCAKIKKYLAELADDSYYAIDSDFIRAIDEGIKNRIYKLLIKMKAKKVNKNIRQLRDLHLNSIEEYKEIVTFEQVTAVELNTPIDEHTRIRYTLRKMAYAIAARNELRK